MSTAETTRTEHWWRSRYGQDDEIGSLNEITPTERWFGACRLYARGRRSI